MAKSKIIVIMGPTASGKSDVAIKLAKKFNGEIISADSRQIYRKMNIGSGKVPGTWNKEQEAFISEGVPHYLIDVADPTDDFNVSHFKTLTNKAIEKILANKKVPIICGGTGFWIQAITDNTNIPEVAPNEKLRAKLEKETLEELYNKLEKLDPERALTIDKQNKYRLVRALEIIDAIGKVPKVNQKSRINNYDFLEIGISVPKEILNEKIKKRLELRLEQKMIEEIKDLQNNDLTWERLENFGLEYRWIARFLQEKVSFEEMKEKLYFDIIHYAKRQMTWFKKNKKIIWLNNYKDIEKEVKKFLT